MASRTSWPPGPQQKLRSVILTAGETHWCWALLVCTDNTINKGFPPKFFSVPDYGSTQKLMHGGCCPRWYDLTLPMGSMLPAKLCFHAPRHLSAISWEHQPTPAVTEVILAWPFLQSNQELGKKTKTTHGRFGWEDQFVVVMLKEALLPISFVQIL